MDSITIIEYTDVYQPLFKELNLIWLQQYGLLEERDLFELDHPREAILHGGGVIYLALHKQKVVGSAAVIVEHGHYELAKMSVAESFRGLGISKLLLEKCIDFTRKSGAIKLLLYSNSQLKSALALYEKYGFQHITIDNSPFVTADVKMELRL